MLLDEFGHERLIGPDFGSRAIVYTQISGTDVDGPRGRIKTTARICSCEVGSNVSLFSGLSLPAGTYFLTFASTSPFGGAVVSTLETSPIMEVSVARPLSLAAPEVSAMNGETKELWMQFCEQAARAQSSNH